MSWLDRNAPFQPHRLDSQSGWPSSSKYTDNGVSDEVARLLVHNDTDFSQELCELQFLMIGDDIDAESHSCYNLYDDEKVLQEYLAGTTR